MATLQEQIALITGPQAPMDGSWFTQTQMRVGKALGLSCPATPPTAPATPVQPQRSTFTTDAEFKIAYGLWANDPAIRAWMAALNDYTVNLHYYDLAHCLYINHARSGDAQFLTLARNAADSYWQHPWIGAGKTRPWPDKAEPSPRHANVGGLILRAMDGRPELWDWLVEYTKAAMNTWLLWRLANTKPHNGIREGAFTLHYAVWLSQTLPDSYPLQAGGTATSGATVRAQFLANAEKVATDYFGRLQLPDGSWRWDDFDASGGPFIGITQPFMVGLLLSALTDLHQVTTNPTVKASVAAQIITAARHLCFSGPYTKQWVAGLSTPLNAFHYFFHGGTQIEPTKYAKGSYPADWNTTNPSDIQNGRQAIGPTIHGLMYAATLANDAAMKTLIAEMWQAAYGDTDRFRNYMGAGDGKSYCQNDRRAPAALALMGGIQQPTPAPTPTPTPDPVPAPPPPPPTSSVPVVTLTAPVNGASLSGRASVTVTATDGAGIANVYLIVDDKTVNGTSIAPYTFTLDTTRLAEGSHSLYVRAWNKLGKAGDSTRITVKVANAAPAPTPTPAPDPIPAPPPAPTPCSMSLSITELTLPEWGTGTVTVSLQNMATPTEVTAVASGGQISVNPGIKRVSGTSASIPFQIAVKRKGGTITFQSPCGSVSVKVNVS